MSHFAPIAGIAAIVSACAACAPVAPSEIGSEPTSQYRMYVTNESADMVVRLGFDPADGFRIERETQVGTRLVELDAPHGVVVAPDGRWFYLTLGHGMPFGSLWKMEAGPDTLVSRVQLGRFPASLDVSPDGAYVFVVNFNLHGDHVPSTLSVVHTETMEEVATPELCVMPHGARIDARGEFVYTVCMHSDQLVTVDARSFEVVRRFSLRPGHEGPLDVGDTGTEMHGGHHGHTDLCRPTWVVPGTGQRAHLAYVACNGSDEVLEVDLDREAVMRRFSTDPRPYNTAISPDARILGVTLRGEQGGATFIDLDTGETAASIITSEPITHGIVFTPDGRFAFVTNESIGSRPGTVDAIDLSTFERVHSRPLYLQPTGIDLVPGAI